MEKRQGLQKKNKTKSYALYDVLADIKIHKTGTLLDEENSDYEKEFNNFIALRFLSMNTQICPLINLANSLQDVLTKKEMYKLLIELIPVIDSHDQFVKTASSKYEHEEVVADYYQCSIKESREYIDVMGNEWANEIDKSVGGRI